MADNNTAEPRVEDLLPVRSRVSWASIFAGAVIALACHLILTLFGSAIGLSISENVRSETLGVGAAVWAIITTLVAMFLGGWVTTQCAVGENKTEAAIHGVIMWGAVLAMILWMVSTGMRTGFNAMLGITYAGAATRDLTNENWESAARRAGVSQETINEWREKAREAPARTREALEDPATRRAALDTVTATTWWTLVGTILSLASAVAGAVAGSGPSFQIVAGRFLAPRVTSQQREYANRS